MLRKPSTKSDFESNGQIPKFWYRDLSLKILFNIFQKKKIVDIIVVRLICLSLWLFNVIWYMRIVEILLYFVMIYEFLVDENNETKWYCIYRYYEFLINKI